MRCASSSVVKAGRRPQGSPTVYDVIVVGGGPSGSTAANLLAREGLRVLVLEREVFPRFHVGESLLPSDVALLRRLGMDPDAHGFVYKAGAEFFDERQGSHREFLFSVALDDTPDHAYQVERAVFDELLLDLAKEHGAEVHEGERVTAIDVGDERVVVQAIAGGVSSTYEARYVIDATGLDAFLGRRDRTVTPIKEFGLAATVTHFHDLDPAIERELLDRDQGKGNVKVFFLDNGWAWTIPLGGRRASVGMVTRNKGMVPSWLDDTIAASPFLSRALAGAHEVRKRGSLASFSFHNRAQHGARWVCAGDSGCFLDPVFSSGVSLGMLGAEHIAEILLPALRDSREADPGLMDAHSAHMARGYDVFATLIHGWYHSRLMHHLFFAPEPDPVMLKGLTTVLAGDVWRDDNPFQNKLMASERRRQSLPATVRGSAAAT